MPRHTNDEPLLVSTVEIPGTPFLVELGNDGVSFINDDYEDRLDLNPRTKEQASQMAMALRLAMRRMNLIADQWA